MSRFRIGDRVEIAGEIATQVQSKVGVILAAEGALSGEHFKVRLADGTESVFPDSQLMIPPFMFADLIFDTHVSPAAQGLRGSTSGRYLRFISREFDIDLNLTRFEGQNNLLGQLTVNEVAPETALVTLLVKGEPYTTTATDNLGEFELHEIPAGDMMLEILVPARRILTRFDVSPS